MRAGRPLHDRAFLLHGSKRDEILSLDEVKQYGIDSFADADYLRLYGMTPTQWYASGVRLLGRTAVECTRIATLNISTAKRRVMPPKATRISSPMAKKRIHSGARAGRL